MAAGWDLDQRIELLNYGDIKMLIFEILYLSRSSFACKYVDRVCRC